MSQRPSVPSAPSRGPWWLQALRLSVPLLALAALVLAVVGLTGAGAGAWLGAGACAVAALALLVVVGLLAMRRAAAPAADPGGSTPDAPRAAAGAAPTTAGTGRPPLAASRDRAPLAPSYDLVVGAERAAAHRPGGPAPVLVGWAGPEGPAIDPATWPRSPRTHQPLLHCATFELPPAYRRRDPSLVGISVFDWPDDIGFLEPPAFVGEALAEGRPDDPFWQDVAAARPHPQGHVVTDPDTGCFYAVVLLTRAELTGPRTVRPREGATLDEGESGARAQEQERRHTGLFGDLYLVERDDPNGGYAPVDYPQPGETDYVDVGDAAERFATSHVGGTFVDPFGLGRREPSPWYLEVHRLGGLWVGDDESLLVDLVADPPVLTR